MSQNMQQISGLEAERLWRTQIFRTVAWVSVLGAAALLALFTSLGLAGSTIPAWSLVGVASTTLIMSLVSLILVRQGRLQWAVVLYVGLLTVTTFASVYLAGGVTGPLVLFVMLFPVLGGLLGGGRTVWWSTGIVILVWAALVLLETSGIVQVQPVSGPIFQVTHYAMFLSTLLLIAWMISAFVGRTQKTLKLAYEREHELNELNRKAQLAMEAERQARDLAGRTSTHLRTTVARYRDYLARVNAGDYTTRIDVGELDEQVEGDRELHALGEYLNTTVERLVRALDEMDKVQRRYMAQAWKDFVRSGRVGRAFRYRQNRFLPPGEVQMDEVRQAIVEGAVVVAQDRVAMPVIVNRQVIGAIGGLHSDGRAWSEEELNLLSDVVGQLAQTVESLRLFEEIQLSAAREQVIGRVIGRVRERMDLEAMLQQATSEIRRSMGLERVAVRLVDLNRLPERPMTKPDEIATNEE